MDVVDFTSGLTPSTPEEIRERYRTAIAAHADAIGAVYHDLTPYQAERYTVLRLVGGDVGAANALYYLRQTAQKHRMPDGGQP